MEDGLTLNLDKLIRDGLIKPGKHVSGSLIWRRAHDGGETASIGYEAQMINPADSWIVLRYSWDGQAQRVHIPLTTTRPHFGGLRWWFLCPVIGDRVGRLHSPPGYAGFASRRALGLSYTSQCQPPHDRLFEKACRLRRRLGGREGLDALLPSRPKGMHHRTYEAMIDDIERLEGESWALAARHFGTIALP